VGPCQHCRARVELAAGGEVLQVMKTAAMLNEQWRTADIDKPPALSYERLTRRKSALEGNFSVNTVMDLKSYNKGSLSVSKSNFF
jgi:hypothetical protein